MLTRFVINKKVAMKYGTSLIWYNDRITITWYSCNLREESDAAGEIVDTKQFHQKCIITDIV